MRGKDNRTEPGRGDALPATLHLPNIPWSIGLLPLLHIGRMPASRASTPAREERS